MSQILNTCITTKFRVCRVCTKYIILMYAIYQTIASDLILSLNIFEGVLKGGRLLFSSEYSQMTSKLFINSERRSTYRNIDFVLPGFVLCPLYRQSLMVRQGLFCDTQIFLQFLQEIFAHFSNILLSNIPKHCDILFESTSVLP